MPTLFVSIDKSSKSSVICAMDFNENKNIASFFNNNQLDAEELTEMILSYMNVH